MNRIDKTLEKVINHLKDPNAQRNLIALHFLEFSTIHCNFDFHHRIGTKKFIGVINDLLKNTTSDHVKKRLIHLISYWAKFFDDEVLPIFKNYKEVLIKKGISFRPDAPSKYEKYRYNPNKFYAGNNGGNSSSTTVPATGGAPVEKMKLSSALPIILETCTILEDLFQEATPSPEIKNDEVVNELLDSIKVYKDPLNA